MSSIQIENPILPLWDDIPGGLPAGKIITLKGIFPLSTDTSQHTQINLCERSLDLIALHLSIRFNHCTVVRNTFQRGDWATEERDGCFPFVLGRQFQIQILVQSHGYQVSVNGQHCWTFYHRLSYSSVTHLNISGPVIIWNVEYISPNNQVTYGSVHSPASIPTSTLIQNPSMPCSRGLPQNLAVGSTVKMKGFYPASTDTSTHTSINLCQNSKSIIACHLSIRFNSRVVVRNSFQHSKWETEERGGPFPFTLGREFLIQILVRPDAYQISVNGSHCWMFVHRLPFSMVNFLNIDGPVNILHVQYVNNKAQKPIQQQQMTRATPPPTASSAPEPVYNPPIPFSCHIDGGIKNGMMIYISGIPSIHFQKFTFDLQCGREQRCPDIAFSFAVCGYNATVVRNTRRGNRWEDQETAAPHFPFCPSVPFDMIILIQNDKYMVAVNGSHYTEYYHRLSRFGKINILRIEGDVKITLVRFDG